MSGDWKPGDYRDEFRDRLRKIIQKRLKSKGMVTPPPADEAEMPENATTNVVDFMALLQQSLASKKRTPAKQAPKKAARPAATRKSASAPTKKKTTAQKATKRTPTRRRPLAGT